MQIAHKIEIEPNNKQKTYLNKCFGISRFAYNWGLAEWKRKYDNKEKVNGLLLKKEFNSIKKEQFPWVKEVTKWACQQPFLDLQSAFSKFFKKQSLFPKFKKKNKSVDSCYISNESFKIVDDYYLRLPLLKSNIKMTEKIRFEGKINSVTLSKKSEKYYASFQIEIQEVKKKIPDRAVGIDIGIRNLFVTSDGYCVESLKPMRISLRRLKRYSRKLSKKEKGSENFKKAKAKLSRLHFKISNQRKDILHKFTTFVVNNYSVINIENLNVKGMLQNRKLSQAISDIGIGEFGRQLKYKAGMRGNVLNIADRFYPSSKMCSECGNVKENLKLSEREYSCENCGMLRDRDWNASMNLKKIGRAPAELTPVEITAMRNRMLPYYVTSIVETGSERQAFE